MRPIKLEMQGFTSFRQHSELHFSELDLFAITGPTGAGKSSLLDAITYALYGKTARLGKSGTARELVSQGCTSMFVALEFHAANEIYRVHRGIKGSSVKARLSTKSAGGEWGSGIASIREIDAAVERIVGLDFEGFTRAVILPQGQFDEFLRGDARQRRGVLKDLLNLQHLESMMQKANAKAQHFTIQMQAIESQVDEEVTDETRKQLENSIATLTSQETQHHELIRRLEQCEQTAEQLANLRLQSQNYETGFQASEQESVKLQVEIQNSQKLFQQSQKELEEIQSAIAAVAYDSDEHFRLTQWAPQAERLEKLRAQLPELNKKKTSGERDLESAAAGLKEADSILAGAAHAHKSDEEKLQAAKDSCQVMQQHYGLPANVRALAPRLKQLPQLEQQISLLRSEIGSAHKKLSGKEKFLSGLADAVEQARTRKHAAEEQLEHFKVKHRAAELRHGLHLGSPCPVCEQTVTTVPPAIAVAGVQDAEIMVQKADEVLAQARAAAAKAPGEFDLIARDIAHYAEKLHDLEASVSSIREQARTMLGAEPGPQSLDQLEQLALSIEQAQKEVDKSDKQVRASREAESEARQNAESLKHKCERSRERLEDITMQIRETQGETEELERKLSGAPALPLLKQQLEKLNHAKTAREDLEKRHNKAESAKAAAETAITDLQGRLKSETSRARKAKKDLEKVTGEIEAAVETLKASAPLELSNGAELATVKRELKIAGERLRDAELARNKQQVQLQGVVEKLEKNRELLERCAALKKSTAIYRELGTLLHANQFQDYMLRSSYQLLAQAGSQYFQDLTGGRYSFHVQEDQFSVRDHANGDDLRSAGTLSGGESFLASLSLALALAQSIAELSGERGFVALESLFLDEGFSTLDPETLGKVADALPALQKKGRLIGVITHVESLAEQLPARIEIEKTSNSSRIVQRGAAGKGTFVPLASFAVNS